MGTLDAIFAGRWHMSPAQDEQARAIVRGFDEVVRQALRSSVRVQPFWERAAAGCPPSPLSGWGQERR